MPAHPIRVMKTSLALRQWYDSCSVLFKKIYAISMLRCDADGIPSASAIFINSYSFFIVATDDNRFYVRPCQDAPFNTEEECLEQERLNLTDALLAAKTKLTLIPRIPVTCYYGAYTNTCEEAVQLALHWESLAPEKLPKNYNPPITFYK